jgi:hypothetical protein
MYNISHPKDIQLLMLTITQGYISDETLEPERSYPEDKEIGEEATTPLPWRSPQLVQHSKYISSSST